MGRVVAVQRLPSLTGTLTDNAVVRADGDGAVQSSGWTIDDSDALRVSGGSIANDDVAADLTVGSARDLGLTGDRDAWLTSDGVTTVSGTSLALSSTATTATITANTSATITATGGTLTLDSASGDVAIVAGDSGIGDLSLTAHDELIVATTTGWTVEGTSYSRGGIIDLFTIAGLAVTDGNFIVGNGTTWVAEGPSDARASLGFLAAFPWAGDVTITDTNLTDVWVSALSIPLGGRYAIVGSMTLNSPAADDIQIQWTATGNVTCAIGHVAPAGSMSGLPENTLSGLIATTGATQRITFFGTVEGGMSGGTIKLQVRKNADAAGTDTTVFSSGTGFSLIPIA